MRFLRRALVGVFLVAVTIGLLTVAGNAVWGALVAVWTEEPRSRPAEEQVFAANVVRLVPETVTPILRSFGEVRARRTLELRASAAGEVIELSQSVEEGGAVEAGEVLVRVDPTDAEATLALARTDLAEARAELRDARRAVELARDDLAAARATAEIRGRALERQQDLLDRGAGTTAAVEAAELTEVAARQAVVSRRQALADAEARVDTANTGVSRQEIAVAEARRRLTDTELAAPFDGVLGEVAVTEGGLVSENEVLARLIDPAALEVAFRVSTAQHARLLDEGGSLLDVAVRATLDVGGVDIAATGRISRESAAVGDGQTGRELFARLEDARGFRPGDFVAVAIEEPPLAQVARLPSAALDSAGTVLVLGEENRLGRAEVELVRRQGDDVLVRAGTLAGAEVVATRSPLLGAGIKVRPNRPEVEATAAAARADSVDLEFVQLSDARRARLVSFVEGNQGMPEAARRRVLAQLEAERVPRDVVERLESRMGG